MTIVGRRYLERGEPVEVLAQWRGGSLDVVTWEGGAPNVIAIDRVAGSGPRNVLIKRADGELVVRPFRGLRRIA